jgi:hypothetical protein
MRIFIICTIIRVIKSRGTIWAGHVEAYMGEVRNAYKILVRSLKGRDHSGDLGVDGRIILIWILRNMADSAGLR